MSKIGAREILDGFRLGYHGGWDLTDLRTNQVVVLEREAEAGRKQIEEAARKGLLETLTRPEGPAKEAA